MARIADSIRVGVGPDATGFWKKFETRVRAQKTPNLEVPVNPGLKKANAELAAWRKAQERDALNIPIRVDEREFKRSVRRIEHTFKQSNLSKAIRLQVYVAGASTLPLLAQGAMSATVAITDLGRALYSLPGLASGALAVVGTLATGLRGLGDAFDAISDASKDSGRKLKDYARAAGDLERAQRDVVQALKEANRAIQDQRDKLSQGALSVEQAVLNVQKANERLAKGGFESWTEYRQAVLDAKQAQLDLREAVKQHNRDIQDYHDNAHIAATETDTVKDAVNRLKDAIDDFNKSQREANGLTDKYLEAMSKLGPVARDFVHQVRGLSDEWQRLQNAVSDQLLAGLGDQIVDLAQRRLPVLQAGMEKVAKGLNSNFKQILSAFDTPENVGRISKIFDNISAALHRANPGIQSFLTGFLHLSEVGSRFLPRMADAFNRVMERFEKFVARTDEDGSLERWIDRGLKLMASLGRSIIYIGSILNSVTEAYEAATGNVGGFAATMERGLKSLSEFLRSPRGQKAMKDYLHDAKLFFDAIRDAMPGIIDLFQAFSDAARNYATVAFPIFAAIGRFLANNAQLSQNLLTVWMLWRTARPVFDMVRKAIFRMGDGMRAYLDRLEAARELEQARSALLLKQRTAERKYNAERIQHIQHTNMELDKLNRAQKQHTEALTRARDVQKRAFQDVAVTQAGMLQLQQKRIRAEESYQRMVEKWGAESRYTKAAATRLAKAYAYEEEAIRVHQQALGIYRVASEDVKRQEEAVASAAAKRAQVVSASNEKVRQSWHAHNVQMQKVNTEIGKVDRAFAKMAGPGGTFGRFRTAIGTTGGAGVLGSLGALGVAIGGVGRDLDQVDRKSRRLADNAGGFGRLRSAIGGQGSGLVGRLGMLGAVLGGSAVSIGVSVGVSIGIIALLEQLAAAQRDAAAAAEEHERRVRELKNTLDSSTGAVTTQTTEQTLEQAREFEIRAKDNKPVTVDVISEAGKLGIDTSTLGRSVDPTQIDAVNHVHESAVNNVVEAIRSGQDQQWNSFGESLKKYGVDERTYAEALIGVPAAKEKFDQARERMAKDVPFSMGGRFVPKGALPDLHTGVENLYRTAPGIAVGQLQQRSLEANRQGGEDIKQRRRPARLNPAGQAKFGRFGVGDVFVSPDGRSVVLNLDRISREELNALERGDPDDPNSGGISVNNILTENPDGTLRVSINLDPEAASRFVNFYKGGAVFGGPTGRDTVPAMLSNGEFVLSKEAVDYWGVDRLAAMNDLKVPGYFLGGLVKDVDFTKPFKAVGNFVGNLFGGNKQEEPKPKPDPNKMASLFGVEPPKDVAPSLKGMGDRGRVDQRVTGVPSPLNDPLKAMQGVKPASQGPEPNLPFTPSRPQSKTPAPVSDPLRAMTGAGGAATSSQPNLPFTPSGPRGRVPAPVSDPLRAMTGAGGVSASSQPNLPFTPSDYPVGRRGSAPTTKDYISGAFTQILNTFGIRGPAVHPALQNRTNLVADAARAVFSSATGLPSNFGTGAAKLPGEESSPRRVEPERRIVDPLRAPLQGRETPREAPGLFDIIGAKPPRRSGPISRQPAPGKPAPGKPAPPAPTPHQGTGSPPGQSSTHMGTGTPPGITDTHQGSGRQPGPTPPSVTATLPGGQVVELDMSGSGALADNEATARSAVQGAPILPEANILKYLRDIGKQWGLFEGVSTFRPNEPSSQHSRARAIDLGGGDAAWSDPSKIEPFVQWWISDPVRVRSTRQLIFAAPSGRKYGIINGRLLSDEEAVQVFGGGNPATLGGHADHVHLALEGVPINAVVSAAPAPGAPIDPTAPGVPIDPTIPGAPIDPNQPFPQQGIPGVDGPIPGPFGPIPFEPLDFLQRIGQAILQAIFGFFGIDITPILDWVNQGISGIPKQQVGPAGQIDVIDQIDQLPPDPGYDPQVAAQMDQMADQARRDGDHDLATALENAAKSYKNRQMPGVPSAMPSSGQIIPHLPRSGLLPGQTSATPSPQEVKNANRALARSMFKNYFPESEWEAFDQLVMRESGYDNWAKNPNSSAFGIGQFLDTTWAQYGWGGERGAATSDPAVQLDLMFRYIRDRYGTPSAALAFHNAHNYYRRGGPVQKFSDGGPVRPLRPFDLLSPPDSNYTKHPLARPVVESGASAVRQHLDQTKQSVQNWQQAQQAANQQAAAAYTGGAGAVKRDAVKPLGQPLFDARKQVDTAAFVHNELSGASEELGRVRAPAIELPEDVKTTSWTPEESSLARASRMLSEGSLRIIPDFYRDYKTLTNWDEASTEDKINLGLTLMGIVPIPGMGVVSRGLSTAAGQAARGVSRSLKRDPKFGEEFSLAAWAAQGDIPGWAPTGSVSGYKFFGKHEGQRYGAQHWPWTRQDPDSPYTRDQLFQLYRYTLSPGAFNHPLRQNFWMANQRSRVDTLTAAIDAAPRTKDDLIVARYVDAKALLEPGEHLPGRLDEHFDMFVGRAVTDPGFMSTSLQQSTAGALQLRIAVPKGARAAYVSAHDDSWRALSGFGSSENELIFQRGRTLVIDHADMGGPGTGQPTLYARMVNAGDPAPDLGRAGRGADRFDSGDARVDLAAAKDTGLPIPRWEAPEVGLIPPRDMPDDFMAPYLLGFHEGHLGVRDGLTPHQIGLDYLLENAISVGEVKAVLHPDAISYYANLGFRHAFGDWNPYLPVRSLHAAGLRVENGKIVPLPGFSRGGPVQPLAAPGLRGGGMVGPIKQDGPGHYDQWLWDLYEKEGRFQEFRPLAFLAQNYPGSGASIANAEGGLIKAWRGGPIKQGPLDNIFGHEADEDWVHSIYDQFYGGNVFDVAMENAQGGLIRKARGGMVRGPGGPTDDKIPALLSNGEFVMRAKAVKAIGAERLAAMNEAPQRFASGGLVIDPKLFPGGVPGPIPQPDAPHQGTGAPPGPPPPGHTPGQPLSIAPALSGLGGLFAPKGGGGSGGVGRPASTERRDPRSNLMAPPEKTDHLHPALRKGIEGAAQTIGSIAATAASTAGSLAGATTPAGPGASAAGAAVASGIQAGAQMAGQVASGVANVVSALLVGNITPGTAGEGSGVPVLPERPVNQFTTVHNGDIVTNNLDEWQRTQDRREAQRTLPFLNRF